MNILLHVLGQTMPSTIVGTSSPDHLRDNLAIAERGPLPADLYEKAKERLVAPAV